MAEEKDERKQEPEKKEEQKPAQRPNPKLDVKPRQIENDEKRPRLET